MLNAQVAQVALLLWGCLNDHRENQNHPKPPFFSYWHIQDLLVVYEQAALLPACNLREITHLLSYAPIVVSFVFLVYDIFSILYTYIHMGTRIDTPSGTLQNPASNKMIKLITPTSITVMHVIFHHE